MPLEVRKVGRFWWCTGTVTYKDPATGDRKSRRVRESTELGSGLPVAEARAWALLKEAAVLRELRGEHAQRDEPRINSITFAQAAAAWLAAEPRHPSDRRRVGHLLRFWGAARLLIDCNSPAACDEAAAAICRRARSADTARRAVHAPVSAIVNHAGVHWHEHGKPRLVSVVSRAATDEARTRWLPPALAVRFLEAAPEHLRPLLRFYLGTGARLMEAIGLPWSDVDLVAGTAILRDTKNGRSRTVALPPRVIVDLANLEHRAGAVFRDQAGEPYPVRDEANTPIRWPLRQLCHALGLVEWAAAGAAREGDDGAFTPVRWSGWVTAHVLRHTWATWFLGATRDPMRLKHEGDWGSLTLVERYAHLMPAELAPAIATVWGVAHPDLFPSRVRARETEERSAVDIARARA